MSRPSDFQRSGGSDGPPISDDELHAYVDGQLAADRLPAVLAWLQARPEAAARVAQWQAQRQHLRQLLRDQVLGETPEALTAPVLRAAGQQRRRAGWQQAVAAVLLLATGVGAGHWWGRTEGEQAALAQARPTKVLPPSFVKEAAMAHAVFVPEKRHPVEVAAADEAHLVQWLSRRLGTPLKVPALGDKGFRLLGGRLLPGESSPRAQFMYENEAGLRLTLYVTVFAPGTQPELAAFGSQRSGQNESFYWVQDQFGYALSAALSPAEMQVLAREVFAQLSQ